jgi:AcrR family transcriptional regulator
VARISAAQRRQDFVQAAIEVIAVHGIDGATTRRIAEEAKANLAMLHYCYDSKEELFSDVYEFVANKFRDLGQGIDPESSVEETARQILRGAMQAYLESPSFTAAALELVSWARRQHGGRGIAVYDQAVEMTRSALHAAGTERRIAPKTIDEIAYVIAILADGFAVNWMIYGDRAAARKQMDVTESVLQNWLAVRLEPAPVPRRAAAMR